MIKAVIFDLDDTLISEYSYVKSGYHAVAEFLANKFLFDSNQVYQELMELFYKNSTLVFNRWYELHGKLYSTEDIQNLVQVYRHHFPNIKFYYDVLPTIKKLKLLGVIIGIVTDGYQETQRQKIRALNAERYFHKIMITDEYGKEYWKPSIKSFELLKGEFNLEYSEMIYIGDNPQKDFIYQKSLGINCYRIIRKRSVYKNKLYLEGITETKRITKLTDVITIVELSENR